MKKTIVSKGSITLFFLFMLLLTCSLSTILIQQNIFDYKIIKNRSQIYLCFKYQVKQTKIYIKKVARSNFYLATLFPLTFIPSSRIYALEIIKMIKFSQQLFKFSYMKNIIKNAYCGLTTPSTFITTKIYLNKRNSLGQLQLNRYQFVFYIKGKMKWNLILKAKFLLKGNTDINPEIKTEEPFFLTRMAL